MAKTKAKSAPKKKSGQTKISSYGRRVLKATYKQTGTSSTERDKKRKALQPGKRRSASGRVYYEHRKNRSDLRGRRTCPPLAGRGPLSLSLSFFDGKIT